MSRSSGVPSVSLMKGQAEDHFKLVERNELVSFRRGS